jgi:hypothetical protein
LGEAEFVALFRTDGCTCFEGSAGGKGAIKVASLRSPEVPGRSANMRGAILGGSAASYLERSRVILEERKDAC